MTTRLPFSTMIVVVVLAACGSQKTAQMSTDSAGAQAGQKAPAAGGMQGMPDMSDTAAMGGMGGMQGGNMMAQMQAHMDSLMRASPERMKAMLPAHRQMAANMLSQMNQQMRSMHMAADAQWTALTDSLRQDLVHMPEMTLIELEGFMPAHSARMARLMEMHRMMMRSMKR